MHTIQNAIDSYPRRATKHWDLDCFESSESFADQTLADWCLSTVDMRILCIDGKSFARIMLQSANKIRFGFEIFEDRPRRMRLKGWSDPEADLPLVLKTLREARKSLRVFEHI